MPLALRSLSDNRNRARVRPVGLRIRLCVCHLAVYFDWSLLAARDALTRRQRPLMVLKRTFVHTYVGGRKADLPREVGPTQEGKVNATAQNAGFLLKWALLRACRYLSYAPPAYECGTKPFLRWVLSQGRSPTRQAVQKMPRTPSAFLFSGASGAGR